MRSRLALRSLAEKASCLGFGGGSVVRRGLGLVVGVLVGGYGEGWGWGWGSGKKREEGAFLGSSASRLGRRDASSPARMSLARSSCVELGSGSGLG